MALPKIEMSADQITVLKMRLMYGTLALAIVGLLASTGVITITGTAIIGLVTLIFGV